MQEPPAWVTDVGNDFGQVFQCVPTVAESDGIFDMTAGLVHRYELGRQPSEVIYVDRDCCSASGKSKVMDLFPQWKDLQVRLDIWHLMCRYASCCMMNTHQLYAVFMSNLSKAILMWDPEDLAVLHQAKRLEMARQEVRGMIDADITKLEPAIHCRRKTRGIDETTRIIDELIESLDGDTGKD